jgi:N-acetylglucosamine-6-phosphate deacetylase
MFNDDQSVDALRRIAEAHRRLGATTIFPTLITDTPERTVDAIAAVEAALAEGVAGIGGLHLEGPHLSLARKGAHDPALIRPMTDEDLARLCDAARRLPALMVTLAPENASPEQVRALVAAGAIVSLGHSDADFATCMAYAEAGASCVTHLFNAMSQLGNREPGLVGATLANGELSSGLIADGIHVHPAAIRAALAAKAGPGRIFLVSDAMAPAGTDQQGFTLNGRTIRRSGGRLQLENGTLAGADLDLTTAIGVLIHQVGIDLADALRMATSVPARVGGQPRGVGRIEAGTACAVLRLRPRADGLELVEVRQGASTDALPG